ncbi:hypothetical protein GS500_23570 [Rhodococcus hoagii]|nr:hypothetical protein [Prescottella equi]
MGAQCLPVLGGGTQIAGGFADLEDRVAHREQALPLVVDLAGLLRGGDPSGTDLVLLPQVGALVEAQRAGDRGLLHCRV